MPAPIRVSLVVPLAMLLAAPACRHAAPERPGAGASAAPLAEQIRLNQLGFYPAGPKVAFVAGQGGAGEFQVRAVGTGEVVFSGRLGPRRAREVSSDTVRVADFSTLRAPGSYELHVPGLGRSHGFEIRSGVHAELARAAAKAFYFQRVSSALEARYAGQWARAAGHPDDRVLVHPSAASPGRPAGILIAAPRGWYDAGDYNKYVVNSGITTATLLSLHEDFPAYTGSMELDIPESGDAVPDVVQEALWNLRWMLDMQDPGDGGVYHKLTTAQFEGFVMPAEARAQRYVVQKSTAAALDFAAVMAQASRVLRPYEAHFPGVADSARSASLRAWSWARRNPGAIYDQGQLNERFDPDIETGAYGDRDLEDEFIWAAAELGVTTGQDSFFTAVPLFPDSVAPVPSWSQVRSLAYQTLVRFRDRLPAEVAGHAARAERQLLRQADELARGADRTAYLTPMGAERGHFVWGSSAVAANQGISLITAYRLTGERAYLLQALANLDYLLGRNATGYSFVTGYGDRTPLHPHHRPSGADAVAAPVPGMLAGGPNPGRQDLQSCAGTAYPFLEPDRSYLDHQCSYASNEIAINWNAPLAYLAAAVEALQFQAGLSPRGS